MQVLLLFLSFVTVASSNDCVLQPFKIATRGRTYQIPVTELSEGVHPANKCGFVVVCSSSRAHVCRHINDKNCPEIEKNCSILSQTGRKGPFRCVTKQRRTRSKSIPNFVRDLQRRKRSETTTSTEALRNDFQTTQPPTTTTTATTPPITKRATKKPRRRLLGLTSAKPEITDEPTSANHPTSFGRNATDSWCVEEEETTEESKTSSSPVTVATTTTTEEVTQTTTKEATTSVNYEESTTTTEGWKLVREGTTSIPVTTTTAITRPFGKKKAPAQSRSHRGFIKRQKRGIHYKKTTRKAAWKHYILGRILVHGK